MGKIIGESFKPYVNKQVEVRQKKLGQSQHDSDFQTWVTNKTPWLRLSSGVNLDSESLRNLGIDILDSDKFQNELLAQNYVLFGGTINANNANPIKGGITSNLESRYLDGNNSYGFDSNTDYGFSPMPGITSATIKSQNRGSLRTAIINLKCHNTNQFDIIESLYLRLKYTILLEWGHTVYYDNNDTLETNPTNDVYKYFLNMGETRLKDLPDTDTSGSYQNQIFKKIEEAREDSGGNYDGFLGWVTNFKWTLLKDGSYDIEINAITIGDVIESLGANASLPEFGATQKLNQEVQDKIDQAIEAKKEEEAKIEAEIAQAKAILIKRAKEIADIQYNAMDKTGTDEILLFNSLKPDFLDQNGDRIIPYLEPDPDPALLKQVFIEFDKRGQRDEFGREAGRKLNLFEWYKGDLTSTELFWMREIWVPTGLEITF
jgi:hypothetical protein